VRMLGTGSATAQIIQAVEYLRKRVKGIHVAYSIDSTEFSDQYESLLEGLDTVTVKRLVATLVAQITITKGSELEKLPGYMKPLPED